MPIIVQKYGGSSLATSAHVKQVADLIAQRFKTGAELCLEALKNLLAALTKLSIKSYQILGMQTGYCLIAPEDAHGISKLEPLPGISRLPDCASVSLIGNDLGNDMQILGIISSKLRLCFFIKPTEVDSWVRALYLENIK